ncbi:hypothetical protein AA0114_g12638 [Alternaria tenuissima]|uniref:TNFR-Cys domain-containing protein n=1 Tax=Alternaria tenuissima TaxID=119927 RepID=A0A4Q4LZI8_9PLEO|nr:hypothetical protein AA0114_g12638 [Alternaria tenuissima]
MFRLSVFALLLLACSIFAFPDPQTNGNSACAKWCADNFPNPGKDCTPLAAKGGGPCWECGPAAPPGHKKILCGGVCVECKGGKTCQGKECKCPAEKPNDCYGTCKAWGTDTDCSRCGDTCKGGKTCQGKECKCPAEKPNDCYGTCKAWGTDTDCSRCGDTCKGGKTCQGKECKCPAEKPNDCYGTCKAWGTDTDCSRCGDTCKDGKKCKGGVCTKP